MNKGQKFSAGYFLAALVLAWLFADLVYKPYMESRSEVPYSTFLADLENGAVDEVDLAAERIVYRLKAVSSDLNDRPVVGGIILDRSPAPVVRNVVRVLDPLLVERLASADVTFGGVAQQSAILDTVLGVLLPFLPLLLLWYFIFKRMSGGSGSVLSFGRSKAQELQGEMTGVHFKDLGGVGEAEVELREIIDFLKEPERYNRFGAKLPKGVLLVGPPGTGKTMLALSFSGSDFSPFNSEIFLM